MSQPQQRILQTVQVDSQGRDNFLGSGVQVWSPQYADNTTMTIKILPALAMDSPRRFVPFRFGAGHEPNEYEQWYFPLLIASIGSGKDVQKFVVSDPEDQNYEWKNNPVHVLYSSLKSLDKSQHASRLPQSWSRLVNEKLSVVQPLKNQYIVQAVILESARKVYNPPVGLDPTRKPCVVLLSKTAWQAVAKEADKVKDNYRGDPDNFLDRYVHGDFTSLTDGFFATFFKEHSDPRNAQRAVQQAAGFQVPQPGGQQGGNQQGGGTRGFENFSCYLHRNYPDVPNGMPANFGPSAQFLLDRAVNFRDIVRPLTHEQQVVKICNALPNYKAAVVHCLQERFSDMIPKQYMQQGQAELSAILNGTPMPNQFGHGPGYVPPMGVPGYGQPGFGAPGQQPWQPMQQHPQQPQPQWGGQLAMQYPQQPMQPVGYGAAPQQPMEPPANPYPAGFGHPEGPTQPVGGGGFAPAVGPDPLQGQHGQQGAAFSPHVATQPQHPNQFPQPQQFQQPVQGFAPQAAPPGQGGFAPPPQQTGQFVQPTPAPNPVSTPAGADSLMDRLRAAASQHNQPAGGPPGGPPPQR